MPYKKDIISELQNQLSVTLTLEAGKRIIYSGKKVNGKAVIVCTPESKMHVKGHGWTDITEIQRSLLEKGDYSILAIRMEGEKTYYLDFKTLKPLLIEGAMVHNEREGNHWKLYIWPDYIEILGNSQHLQITPNNLNFLEELE